MPKKSPMYLPTYCMMNIAVAVTFIATVTAASTLAVFLLKTTTYVQQRICTTTRRRRGIRGTTTGGK